ncbi:hypothetical protein [Chitinolyticbacter meiyuanensis]|uniref:hypothetical protein n=1 Tax=Chitinolyticbacter meiyuanensis TaxID=682798 RepID=UPI0011E5F39D|nr:hypothetical protein [Chitinolyticbacter meiyuanensis]
MPQFLNRTPLCVASLLQHAPVMQAHTLYDSLIVEDVLAGNERDALVKWSTQQQFWWRIAEHAGDLLTLMIANAHLDRGARLLNELLERRPGFAASIGERERDVLAMSAHENHWLLQAAHGEFRFFAHIIQRATPINALREHCWRSLPEALITAIWLRPHHTINRYQRQLAGEMARLGLAPAVSNELEQYTCGGPIRWWAADWVGEQMACAGTTDWSRYLQRVEQLRKHSQSVLDRLDRVNGAGAEHHAVR